MAHRSWQSGYDAETRGDRVRARRIVRACHDGKAPGGIDFFARLRKIVGLVWRDGRNNRFRSAVRGGAIEARQTMQRSPNAEESPHRRPYP